jgi:beta-carotene hydroxylase
MHRHPEVTEIGLPTIEQLGRDLLRTTPLQRRLALARPFVGLAAYLLAVALGWWVVTPVIVFLIFVAVVTVTHDVVHGSLGLSKRQSEWALFLMGAALLESGHAYRITHHQHHSHFPDDDDPEGYPAKIGLLGAVVYGPVFLARLWWWAFQRRPDQRGWLLAEAFIQIGVLLLGLALWPTQPAVLLYWGMAMVGSWVYPLLTVYLPHKDYGDHLLNQTHTLRGRIIPALFLELTYHLEHHLYPQVPSHHLAKLAQRLDPYFARVGVKVWHVI